LRSRNRDAATLGEVDQQTFNHEASLAITWTKRNLKAEGMEYLMSLPEKLVVNDVTIVHGSPHNPVWDYVMDYMTASRMFQFYDTRICLVGHTHVPAIWKNRSHPTQRSCDGFSQNQDPVQNDPKSRFGGTAP
jgi:diadenosine tetraphosphatase ApaH/serine/threonine PP2A family protein phosphatase